MATTAACLEAFTAVSSHRYEKSETSPSTSQRDAATQEQPWTATRCHRQLRPLLTHLMALRREKTRAALKRASESKPVPAVSTSKRPVNTDDNFAIPKRVRYTYSLKGCRRRGYPSKVVEHTLRYHEGEMSSQKTKFAPLLQQAKRSFCPGEVVVATPVLSRARKHRQAWSLPSSPLIHRESKFVDNLPHADSDTLRHKHRNSSFKYRGYYQDSIRMVVGSAAKLSTSPCMDADWVTLFRSTPPESHQTYEAIFRAIEALLRTTMTCSEGSASNSKSLLAMCLRKIPQYVVACEDAVREDAEKEGEAKLPSTSVSLGIYSELETLGNGQGGWKHLGTVVRQHGIDNLLAACAEGLLHQAFVHLLVRLCTYMRAYSEAEGLLTALFGTYISSLPRGQLLYEMPSDAVSGLSDPTGPLSSLKVLLQYSEDTGRTSVPLQLIADLLNREHLPSAWLSTSPFCSLWRRIVRLLSSRSLPICDESILLNFVAVAVAHLAISSPENDTAGSNLGKCRRSRSSDATSSAHLSPTYHTLVSILGNISAVGILQQEAASEDDSPETGDEPLVLKRLSIIIQHSLTEIMQISKRRKGRHKLESAFHGLSGQFLLVLAVRLSQQDIMAPSNILLDASILRHFENKTTSIQKGQIYDLAVALVTSTAENCGRAAGSTFSGVPASRSYLLALCAQAADFLSNALDYGSTYDLTNRLQVDAAFLLASRSNDLRDLAFAESIGAVSAQASAQRPDSPSKLWHSRLSRARDALPPTFSRAGGAPASALFEGYHWEEGISEWVVSTPNCPGSVQSQNLKHKSQSELVILLDDFFTQHPLSNDDDESTRQPSTNRVRPDPSASPHPSSQTSEYDSGLELHSSVKGKPSLPAPRLPKTYSSTSGCQSSKLRPLRTGRSLLNFIFDDEDKERDELEMIDKVDLRPARLPLSDLAGNVNKTRRSLVPRNTRQNKKAARSSDDELGL